MPLEFSDEGLLGLVESPCRVTSVSRQNRRVAHRNTDDSYVPTETTCIVFEGKVRPVFFTI